MPRPTPAENLPRHEWNFDGVPDDELVACCYWEYARESAFIRKLRQQCIQNWRSGGCRDQKLHEELQRAQSIGYPSEVFLRGFFFEPNINYQSKNEKLPNGRHPNAPAITGSFPQPWQLLSQVERKCRSTIKEDVTTLELVPFQISHWYFAKVVACYVESQPQQMKEKLPPNQGLQPIRPGLGISNAETLLVDIAWDFFTDDQIVNYFRRWVKYARPKDRRAPSGRGHKPGDWRAALTRLAVMRLLSRFAALRLVAGNAFPEIWKSSQFAGRKWTDVTKWHAARREARQTFQKLFPFLPKSNLPLSWKRPVPAN